MRKAFLTTVSAAAVAALAAGPASAADMLSVGVGGYMQQWFGMSSVDDDDDKIKDGVAQQSDSEIFFKGKLETDAGLTFAVKVELEANSSDIDVTKDEKQGNSVIDESQLTIGGSFGKITLGAEDPASTLAHYGGMDVGISLNCGDTHKWIGGLAGCSHNGFGTYGHGHGDKNQIMYFTPRVSGLQLGLSYIPDAKQEHSNKALNDNDEAAWAVGANYMGEFGDGFSLGLSVGHYQGSRVAEKEMIFDGKEAGANASAPRAVSTYTASLDSGSNLKADEAAVKKWTDALAMGKVPSGAVVTAAQAAQKRIDDHMIEVDGKADDRTFSNVGLQVGMGGFTFSVAYAAMDGGAYKVERMDKAVTTGTWDHDGDASTDAVPQTQVNNPADDIVMSKLVKDEAKNWDTWGTGVRYVDGPMAVSLSHLATEWDNGDEQNASMLSLSYTLAPGVASKSSMFMAERSFDSTGRDIDGTGFVTGIAINF